MFLVIRVLSCIYPPGVLVSGGVLCVEARPRHLPCGSHRQGSAGQRERRTRPVSAHHRRARRHQDQLHHARLLYTTRALPHALRVGCTVRNGGFIKERGGVAGDYFLVDLTNIAQDIFISQINLILSRCALSLC